MNLLKPPTTCTNLHNFTQSEKSFPQNSVYCMVPFYEVLEQAYLTTVGGNQNGHLWGWGGGPGKGHDEPSE